MSHYYNRDTGLLLPSVQIKSGPNQGQWREATLADARKVNALVSVTTVLGMLAKPGLVKWQVEQGIKAASQLEWRDDDPMTGDLINLAYQKSQEYTRYTQDFGTATHWWLNHKLRAIPSTEIPPMIPGAEEIADGILEWLPANGYEFSLTEHRFVRPDLGYAGTVDLIGTHHGKPCLVDLKTQEPPLTPYPEYAYQLAGYDYALEPVYKETDIFSIDLANPHLVSINGKDIVEVIPRERISLIANRLVPGEVHQVLWVDKGSTIEATNARYNKIWLGLLQTWMDIHQYDPRSEPS